MRIALALLGAPSVALTTLTIMYAMVPLSCGWRSNAPLHAISVLSLVFALAATGLAWREWHGSRAALPDAGGHRAFLAQVATCVGALSVLSIAALAIPPLLLSPCL